MNHAPHTAAPRARVGLLLPGLGHLRTGRHIEGIGLLGGLLILLLSLAGASRLDTLLDPSHRTWGWHGPLSLLAWLAVAGVLWRSAWGQVQGWRPPPGSTRAALRRSATGQLGFVGVGWLTAITLLAPMLAPFDPDATFVGARLAAPSALHWLGTDEYGRDQASRVLAGARVSMSIGFLAVGIAASLGTTLGALAGYFGGWLDRAVMWVVDLLLAVPRLVLLLAIVGLFRPPGATAIFLIVTVLGFTGWMGVSRIVRSQVLSLKAQDFVAAARALGMSHSRILFRHIIPNATAPVIVYGSLAIGTTMLAEASLSFLGLGVQPPTSTWGTLVADGRHRLQSAPWVALSPGLAIVFAVMSFNLLGDGLRDALDPRQRER